MRKKTTICLVSIAVVIIVTLLNAFEINPRQLNVRTESIVSNKISKSFDDTIIAYFSDLNYGFGNNDKISKVYEKIIAFNPDIIIFGGDLLSSSITTSQKEELISVLSDFECEYGKYAILGECDNDEAKSILEQSGFAILDNESVQIYKNTSEFINVVGVSNNYSEDAFKNVNPNHYSLSVSHYPDNFDMIKFNKADYVLAGHSLGGQVYIPLLSVFLQDEGAKTYYRGKKDYNGIKLDITNGVGVRNKNARLLADAEIVIYKLKTSD